MDTKTPQRHHGATANDRSPTPLSSSHLHLLSTVPLFQAWRRSCLNHDVWFDTCDVVAKCRRAISEEGAMENTTHEGTDGEGDVVGSDDARGGGGRVELGL